MTWHNCSDLTFLVPSEGLYVGRDSILHGISLLVLELWRCEIGISIGKEETHFSPPLCHRLSRHWDACALTCRRLNQQSPLLERSGGKQNLGKGRSWTAMQGQQNPSPLLVYCHIYCLKGTEWAKGPSRERHSMFGKHFYLRTLHNVTITECLKKEVASEKNGSQKPEWLWNGTWWWKKCPLSSRTSLNEAPSL